MSKRVSAKPSISSGAGEADGGAVDSSTPALSEVRDGGADSDSQLEYIEFEDGHTGETVRLPVRPAPSPAADGGAQESPAHVGGERSARPIRWMRATRPPCAMRGRRRICDGPLRVPEPSGAALELARRLGLGSRAAAGRLMEHGPRRAWVNAVHGSASRSLLFPVPGGRMGRGVGLTRRGRHRRRPHNGVDIGARTGQRVVAANDGLVAYSHNGLSGYGNLVILIHADATVTFYAHLEAAYVQPGERLRRGETVGEVGATGLASGPHLHFEWRREGTPLDPAPRFVR